MRIALVYRFYKEGKLDLTKEEMNALWKFYENLSVYNTYDRKALFGYKYICGKLLGENPYEDNEIWDNAKKEEEFEHVKIMLKRASQKLLDNVNPTDILS